MIVLLSLFHMTHWSCIWITDDCSVIIFVKHFKITFFSKFSVSILIELRKKKSGFYSKFLKIEKIVYCSFIFGHGWLDRNQFGKTCQNWCCPSRRCLCCMMAIAGAFTTKQQWMHPHCFVYYDKTWMKTVLATCFTEMIAEQPSLTQYEWPIWMTCLVMRRSWVRFLSESACDIFFTAAQICTEHSVFIYVGIRQNYLI